MASQLSMSSMKLIICWIRRRNTKMAQTRHTLCNCILTDHSCITIGNSILGIICWLRICLEWWGDIGIKKDTYEQPLINSIYLLLIRRFTLQMMLCKNTLPITENISKVTNSHMLSFKDIWIPSIPKNHTILRLR